MTDDYLFDGKGSPDPDVRRLEERLRPIGHAASKARRDRLEREFFPREIARRSRFARVAAWSAAAAAVLVAVLGGLRILTQTTRSGWEVERLAGVPTIAASPMTGTGRLSVGARIETDGSSRARIRIGAIGEAEVEPNSRVRLVQARPTEHRLSLEAGKIRARIWAPPRLFYVETPSATAVDLGCAYTLEVDGRGVALLRVLSGWVAFDDGGRESFVPEGAACETRPGAGPGTPWFEDAGTPFREALARLDFDRRDPSARSEDLSTILRAARTRDALTLWHLLSRVEGQERIRVFERLSELVPPPDGATRERILAGDRDLLDAWWDRLGLGVTTWWRLSKSPGPPG
jgi:hypothetical protein